MKKRGFRVPAQLLWFFSSSITYLTSIKCLVPCSNTAAAMKKNIGYTVLAAALLVFCLLEGTHGEDPYLYFTWKVSYGTLSPLGIPQQVILINDQFPGPNINSTSNNNVVINVFNNLDEPLLFSWNGIQQRKNSWQDGTPGTMCPIPPGQNYTYHFQVKDQIGSYFYYPSIGFQKAAGGYGGLRVNSRLLIPVPYADPEDDYTILAGDWYTESHTELQKQLDSGKALGRPDGILINGKAGKVGDANEEPVFTMKPGKTYKYRVCNVGLRNSINFRFQGHAMKLVEMEGSHVVQNSYDSFDVHLGQCFSFLVTALPEAPVGWAWSLNQFRSYRWNLTASAARPNPQGSYHYGSINITRTVKFVNSAEHVDGKLRYAINGVSHTDPDTPLKIAEYYNAADKLFKYDSIPDDPPAKFDKVLIQPNVLNFTFRTFIEIIFENHEKSVQSWHLNGYSFFAVAIEPGRWTPDKRKNYNLLDAVSRNTIHVYPKSWAAIMLTFDNAGMWNLRSEIWERRYLGQQLYISVISPARSLRDEYNLPDNSVLCGIVKSMPKPPPYSI